MQIIDRKGEIHEFVMGRIHSAVDKAFLDVRETHMPEPFRRVLDTHFGGFHADMVFEIEAVQDMIEDLLWGNGYKDVAKGYMSYRMEHDNLRLLQERYDYIEKYINSADNAATSSETDANANIAMKNVANLSGETYKTLNRQMQRYAMRKQLKQMYPELERQYEKDLSSHIIYAHDESSYPIQMNYCEAVSLYPFVQYGTSCIDGSSAPAPRHLSSFAGQFGNLVFLLASQCKGAVAFGSFFTVMDYYCVKDFGEDWLERLDEPASLLPPRTVLETIEQVFQQITHTINQPAGNRCAQSPFTNVSYYDSGYWHALFGELVFPDGTKPAWERVSFLQKRYMKWLNAERTKVMLTFPVETMALLHDGRDVIDKEYKEFTAEMYAEGHSFFTYLSDNPNALASCCRLRNEIHENSFSFTNGLTGIQTGSVNVITLNLNRIIQDWARANGLTREQLAGHFFEHGDSFQQYLVSILDRVYKYHTAYKTMVYDLERKGMLSASSAGFIPMRKLYSTIGENGINEAAEFVGIRCSYNDNYKRFCRLVTGTISRENRLHSTDPEFLFNQEFVPAESLSSKNCNWDREDGYWVPEGRILYNSYFYLADDPGTSILDKFKLHGREFTELLDGGVGLHCNLVEHMSREQYLHMIDFAIEVGTSYFTFNVLNCECTNRDCHYIVKRPMPVCPKCGARMRPWTRPIGYLRPVDNFDWYRWQEAGRRHYADPSEVE